MPPPGLAILGAVQRLPPALRLADKVARVRLAVDGRHEDGLLGARRGRRGVLARPAVLEHLFPIDPGEERVSLEVDGAGLRPETTRHVGVQQAFDEILRRVG